MRGRKPDPPFALTARELEVLNLVGEGQTNAEIGCSLGCAEGTVRKHLDNIYAKLKVGNRISALNRFAELSESE